MEVKGLYIKTKERNEFTKWTVFVVKEDNTQHFITCTGYVPSLISSEAITLYGTYRDDNTFKVEKLIVQDKESTAKKYLENSAIKGVGERIIKSVLEALNGKDIFEYLEENNRFPQIKGLSNEIESELIKFLKNTKALRDFLRLCDTQGISYKDSMNIYERFGKSSSSVMKNSPFRLANEGFISIYLADKISNENGLDWLADERIDAFIFQALKNAQMYGNTYIMMQQLQRFVSYICERTANPNHIPSIILAKRLRCLKEKRQLHIISINDEKRIYTKEMYEIEKLASKEIQRLENNRRFYEIDEETIKKIEKENGFNYADNQKDVFRCLDSSGIKIITGGPGTGKTTVINGILKYIKEKDFSYVLCAPTGRASQRLAEVTGEEASTIHKLLDIRSYGNDFICKGKEDPICADYIICDEMSMVGIEIFAKLLNAAKNGTTVILVGDPDQLQSVQAGNVLEDLLKINYKRA